MTLLLTVNNRKYQYHNIVIISVKIKFHNNIVVGMEFYTMISLQGNFVVLAILITNDIYNN